MIKVCGWGWDYTLKLIDRLSMWIITDRLLWRYSDIVWIGYNRSDSNSTLKIDSNTQTQYTPIKILLRIKLKCGLVCELTLRVNRHSNGLSALSNLGSSYQANENPSWDGNTNELLENMFAFLRVYSRKCFNNVGILVSCLRVERWA